MNKVTMLCAAVAVSASAGVAFAQTAPTGGGNCMVEQAAQAALDREIKLIEALAVDVEGTFNGPQGCIDASIFQQFDLSKFIPNGTAFLSGAATELITTAIQSAKDKVCQKINDKITDAVGTAQGTISNFSSGLTDELSSVLDNGWSGLKL